MRKITIKLLALAFFVILCAPVAMAQVEIRRDFREPGVSVLNVGAIRATFSRISWVPEVTITACSFKIEESSDGVTWTELTPSQDCTSSGKFEFITPPLSIIRFNVSALTIGQRLILFWEGDRGIGCGLGYSGILTKIIGPDPAAEDELSIIVPTHEKWRVHSALFKLQTSNVVADREVFLSVLKDGDEVFRTFADGVVKANQMGIFTTVDLGFVGTVGLGPASLNQPTGERTIMVPISNAFIPGGSILTTDTIGIQTGDDYGPPIIVAEKCSN